MNPVEEARRSIDEPRRAIALLRRFPALLGRDPEAAYLLGVAHFRLREFDPAERAFRQAIRLDPTMARAFYYLGLTMERRGRQAEAIDAYRNALDLAPQLEKARLKLQQLGVTERPSRGQGGRLRSELDLPENDDDFDDYARRIRRKRMIDQRAQYAAQVKAFPSYGWVVMAVMLLVVLLIGIAAVIILVRGFSIVSAMLTSSLPS